MQEMIPLTHLLRITENQAKLLVEADKGICGIKNLESIHAGATTKALAFFQV